jgi:rhodanese-related sulfurtransferase
VAAFLAAQGYQAVNLAGGIDAWAADLEPSLPRY